MKFKSKIISVVTASLLSTSLFATTLDIKEGWSMYGLTEGIEDLNSTFNNYPNNIRTIWAYDSISGKWKYYSPNNEVKKIIENSGNNFLTLNTVAPKEGFWIDAYSDVQVETDTYSSIISNEDNSTIIPDEENTTVIPVEDNSSVNIVEDNSTIAILEEKYNVCKSTKFGLISNIEDNSVEEFDINNPFSYIDTGVTISTSKDFDIFYNHTIYNNNIDKLEMYIDIENKYLAKIDFKEEFKDKSFVVIYNNNRYIGKFQETTLPYNLTKLDEDNTNYPPLIGELNQTLTTTVELNDLNETIKYCDQNNDTLSFNLTSDNNTIADASIINTNIISFDAKKIGDTTITLNIDDGIVSKDIEFGINVTPLMFDNIISNGGNANGISFSSFKSETIEFNTIDNLYGQVIEFNIDINGTLESKVNTPNDMTGKFRYKDDNNITYIGDFEEAIKNGEITLSNEY